MDTLTIVLIVLTIDIVGGFILKQVKKVKRAKEMHNFDRQLGQIFQSEMEYKEKIIKAKNLCRNTNTDEASGAYFVLDYIHKHGV